MADKKKFVLGADEPKKDKKAPKAENKKTESKKAPKAESKGKKAEKTEKESAVDVPKLPPVKELDVKKIMKRVNVKDAEAVKAEIARLDDVAAQAAEQGNAEVEEAALAASHALASAAASNEPAAVLPLSPEQGEAVKKDREKVSRLKKSEITPEQEMARLESAKKKAEKAEAAKQEREAKKAEREAKKAEKRAEAEKRSQMRRDPEFLLAERRRKAEERGKPYPDACLHCGSPDLVANRSAYNAEIDMGDGTKRTEVVQEYICRTCHLYTKAVASTGEKLPKEATVKNLGYVTERENYHRAKGHLVPKAIELAEIEDTTMSDPDELVVDTYLNSEAGAMDQIIGLNKLLSVALTGDDEAKRKARAVLADGVVLRFDMSNVTVSGGTGTVTVESQKGASLVTEEAKA